MLMFLSLPLSWWNVSLQLQLNWDPPFPLKPDKPTSVSWFLPKHIADAIIPRLHPHPFPASWSFPRHLLVSFSTHLIHHAHPQLVFHPSSHVHWQSALHGVCSQLHTAGGGSAVWQCGIHRGGESEQGRSGKTGGEVQGGGPQTASSPWEALQGQSLQWWAFPLMVGGFSVLQAVGPGPLSA